MNLEKTIRQQIDDIMDSTDFHRISESFRHIEHCWLNNEPDDYREIALRKSCRERLYNASNGCIKRYHNEQISFRGLNDLMGDFYEGMSDTGCIKAECSIYGGDEEQPAWVRVNMTCYVENTVNDGEEFND